MLSCDRCHTVFPNCNSVLDLYISEHRPKYGDDPMDDPSSKADTRAEEKSPCLKTMSSKLRTKTLLRENHPPLKPENSSAANLSTFDRVNTARAHRSKRSPSGFPRLAAPASIFPNRRMPPKKSGGRRSAILSEVLKIPEPHPRPRALGPRPRRCAAKAERALHTALLRNR
jgi:hypothetical protein